MPASYGNLQKLGVTEENPGGVGSIYYWAPTSDITTIQEPANLSTATSPDDLAAIATAHVFATGKMFQTGYCTQGKGELDYENASEVDASGGFFKFKGFLPGYNKTNFGLLRMKKGDEFILIVPMADGKKAQLGTSAFPCKVLGYKFMSAQNGSGVRGVEITYQAFQMTPFVYESTLQLTPAP